MLIRCIPRLLFVMSLSIIAAGAVRSQDQATTPLVAVPFPSVTIQDAFWSPRLKIIQSTTVEANLRQCEVTGRLRNFAIAGGLQKGKHEGALYNDSDVYKVLEGVAYCLKLHREPHLEARADKIIVAIAAAQQPDGYLNTYYTLVKPQEKWTNIAHGHELYCAGHLMEAAVAYYQATGKRQLLDVAIRKADHILSVFGPHKRPDPCGHQEIELALVKLWRVTGERKYLDLARFFIDSRGVPHPRRKLYGEYAQDHKPVRDQMEVVGHAVRAMYQYCAMADLASVLHDDALMKPLLSIWNDIINRKMYLTGGIGPSARNEGFTVPYDLPNDTAYAETCAAIGMALWNHRMFLMTGEARFIDIVEREIYNGLLSGISLYGEKFFYSNPLGSRGNHHRVPWFDCSCCPTNIVRYLPGLGERVYATEGNNHLFALLYLSNSTEVKLGDRIVKLTQQTRYPWEGVIQFKLDPDQPTRFALHLRIPGWLQGVPVCSIKSRTGPVTLESEPGILSWEKGFLVIDREWRAGDSVELSLPMQVRRIYADPQVKANAGHVALMRGPIVYCLEGADHPGSRVRNLVLPPGAEITANWDANLLGGITRLNGKAQAVTVNMKQERVSQEVPFTAVPYAMWDNRAPGEMVVWLPEHKDLAEVTTVQTGVSNGLAYSASHCGPDDTLVELNSTHEPVNSHDQSTRRMTWWPQQGTNEWLTLHLPHVKRINRVRVYWYDDTGRGQCRVPASWKLLYKEGENWKPVKLAAGNRYNVNVNCFNEVEVEGVITQELRLQVELQAGYSAGVMRWKVH